LARQKSKDALECFPVIGKIKQAATFQSQTQSSKMRVNATEIF